MILYTINHNCIYECEKICRIFFPTEKIVFASGPVITPFSDSKTVISEVTKNDGEYKFYCKAEINSQTAEFSSSSLQYDSDFDRFCELELAKVISDALTKITGIVPEWGLLTGVRPSKLLRRLIRDNGKAEAMRVFTQDIRVNPQKAMLTESVAEAEAAAIALSKPHSCSLYISIPFCPTRCSYCSFVSHSIEQAKKLIPDYVRLLCSEIQSIAEIIKSVGLCLETVYIGGGTPTSLSAQDLEKITDTLLSALNFGGVREFTVEAGRPDTITEDKLSVLKNAGVSRISINPQSFSDEVLRNIGRRHTADDILKKFSLAREMGFDNINMDFIAGLPGDTPDSFKSSILKAISLSPENITVHTLALKRASSLVSQDETDRVCRDTAEMVDFAGSELYKNGYTPYYMYRQSKSVGNLENVGWCKPGAQCLYNIYMMEEIHTVLAAGGGAVTKLKAPHGDKIERIYNFKYPYEYISRFDEQNERKKAIPLFYKENT